MPKLSNKTKAIDLIVLTCLQQLMELDSDCEEEEDDIMDNALSDLSVVLTMRSCAPFSIGSVPRSKNWLVTVLPALDDDRFKTILRVTRQQFSLIYEEIKQDPLFNGVHSSKQLPSELQLAVFLYKLGSTGEGGTVAKVAGLFGIGDGGSVEKVCRRVMEAILNKKENFLDWPDEGERLQIVVDTFDEMPHCVGYLGGSEIKLAEKPLRDSESFYSRKQQYSIKAQIVCDHKLRVRNLVVGDPGGVHDATIFSNSALRLHPEEFFSGAQWLAASTAYPLTTTVLTPFRKPIDDDLLDHAELKHNLIFSSYRVRVDHCFGAIKERFNSLKDLKMKIKDSNSIRYACQWIDVACILHNMLIEYSEDSDELNELVKLYTEGVGEGDEEEEDEYDEEEDDDFDDTLAVRKRDALMEILCTSP